MKPLYRNICWKKAHLQNASFDFEKLKIAGDLWLNTKEIKANKSFWPQVLGYIKSVIFSYLPFKRYKENFF